MNFTRNERNRLKSEEQKLPGSDTLLKSQVLVSKLKKQRQALDSRIRKGRRSESHLNAGLKSRFYEPPKEPSLYKRRPTVQKLESLNTKSHENKVIESEVNSANKKVGKAVRNIKHLLKAAK